MKTGNQIRQNHTNSKTVKFCEHIDKNIHAYIHEYRYTYMHTNIHANKHTSKFHEWNFSDKGEWCGEITTRRFPNLSSLKKAFQKVINLSSALCCVPSMLELLSETGSFPLIRHMLMRLMRMCLMLIGWSNNQRDKTSRVPNTVWNAYK